MPFGGARGGVRREGRPAAGRRGSERASPHGGGAESGPSRAPAQGGGVPAGNRVTKPGLVHKIKFCSLSQLPELILVWALGCNMSVFWMYYKSFLFFLLLLC